MVGKARAPLMQAVRAEAAILEGGHAVLADLTKFFDTVTLAVLWKEALTTNLPFQTVWLCLAMYGGKRRI